MLLKRALPYQLKAKTNLEFAEDGVRRNISIPWRIRTSLSHDKMHVQCLKGYRLLIVEDDYLLAYALSRALEEFSVKSLRCESFSL